MLPQSRPQANACVSPAKRVSASSCSISRIDAARLAHLKNLGNPPDSNQPKCALSDVPDVDAPPCFAERVNFLSPKPQRRQLSAATSTEAGWWGPFAKR